MKLTKYLKAVQALQAKALNRSDIYMFEIDTRHYEDGDTSLWITTRLLAEENFHYFTFYTFLNDEENGKALAELTAWMDGK